LSGWNVRPFDWQFSAGVQQQVLPRVSVDVTFSRRSWGNFTYTDNLAVGPSDFDNYTFVVPAGLPNSGQTLTYALRNNNTPFGAVNNYLTLASDYGDVAYSWKGVDMTVNARTAGGFTLQGGFTSGAGHRDQCALWAALPELTATLGVAQPLSSCRVDEPWSWNWQGLANYPVPKIDVQVAAIMRSQANVQATNDPGSSGLSQSANYFETNANVLKQLGRGIAGGLQTTTLNLAPQGTVYPDRLNTVDLRVSKIIKIKRTRTNVGIDLYNLFNANTGTSFNQNFGTNGATYLRPNAILNPRYVRFNATVNF
jgi:hypothetical protein